MSPSAERLQHAFVRLSAEEPFSLYVEQFLRDGFDAWPQCHSDRFPGLQPWTGIASLKNSLRQLAGSPADTPVIVASRSMQLMKLAARVCFRVCRNVLATDLSWPAYQNVLEHEARRTAEVVTTVAVRDRFLREQASVQSIVERLATEADGNRCDGLIIPAVDHLGVRVPVAEIVHALQRAVEIRFVVVDAAQAFGHIPLDDCLSCSDFLIAGCHKWVQAYQPLGVSFSGRPRFRSLIANTCRTMQDQGELDDPLLAFIEELERGRLDRHSETVNLAPLFSCCGALADVGRPAASLESSLAFQHSNAEAVKAVAAYTWRPVEPAKENRSGILLLESSNPAARKRPANVTQEALHRSGLLATAYDGGVARLSMPKTPLPSDALSIIGRALHASC